MLNKIMLIGNVGRDPEMSYTPSGSAVTKFSLAVTQRFTDKASGEKRENTTWFNCVAWNTAAETLSKWVKKGHKLYIEGRMGSREYTDKDNVKRQAWDVTVTEFEFLTSAQGGNGNAASDGESTRDAEDFPF